MILALRGNFFFSFFPSTGIPAVVSETGWPQPVQNLAPSKIFAPQFTQYKSTDAAVIIGFFFPNNFFIIADKMTIKKMTPPIIAVKVRKA